MMVVSHRASSDCQTVPTRGREQPESSFRLTVTTTSLLHFLPASSSQSPHMSRENCSMFGLTLFEEELKYSFLFFKKGDEKKKTNLIDAWRGE